MDTTLFINVKEEEKNMIKINMFIFVCLIKEEIVQCF